MREHPVIGERILRAVPGMAAVARMIRHEHERYDGGGYPDGLRGDDIPMGSRVILACDAYHAMTSDRPYRRAMDVQDAVTELVRCAGTQFDPQRGQRARRPARPRRPPPRRCGLSRSDADPVPAELDRAVDELRARHVRLVVPPVRQRLDAAGEQRGVHLAASARRGRALSGSRRRSSPRSPPRPGPGGARRRRRAPDRPRRETARARRPGAPRRRPGTRRRRRAAGPRRRPRQRVGRQPPEDLAGVRGHQRLVHRALGREVLVDEGLGDPGRARDLLERRAVVTAGAEDLLGGVEELLAALGGRRRRRGWTVPGIASRLGCGAWDRLRGGGPARRPRRRRARRARGAARRARGAGLLLEDLRCAADDGRLCSCSPSAPSAAPPKYTAREIAEKSGLSISTCLTALRRAHGLPVPEPDAVRVHRRRPRGRATRSPSRRPASLEQQMRWPACSAAAWPQPPRRCARCARDRAGAGHHRARARRALRPGVEQLMPLVGPMLAADASAATCATWCRPRPSARPSARRARCPAPAR